jgi:hypothetical protein
MAVKILKHGRHVNPSPRRYFLGIYRRAAIEETDE